MGLAKTVQHSAADQIKAMSPSRIRQRFAMDSMRVTRVGDMVTTRTDSANEVVLTRQKETKAQTQVEVDLYSSGFQLTLGHFGPGDLSEFLPPCRQSSNTRFDRIGATVSGSRGLPSVFLLLISLRVMSVARPSDPLKVGNLRTGRR